MQSQFGGCASHLPKLFFFHLRYFWATQWGRNFSLISSLHTFSTHVVNCAALKMFTIWIFQMEILATIYAGICNLFQFILYIFSWIEHLYLSKYQASWACRCSVTKSCPTLCDPTDRSMPGFSVLTISQSLPKFMSSELVMPFNHFAVTLFPSVFNLSQHQGLS